MISKSDFQSVPWVGFLKIPVKEFIIIRFAKKKLHFRHFSGIFLQLKVNQFNKDATHLRDGFWNSYFEETLFSECFHILFKVVHCLSVTLTTDTLSKAIMNPSSVQLFSNLVSQRGVMWSWAYTPPGISSTWDSLVNSLAISRDWFLIYEPEKVLARSGKMEHHATNHCYFQEWIIWTVLRSETKTLRL